MPYCPKCGVEYREGFDYCYDCNAYLVDSLEECQSEEKSSRDDMDEWVFLANVSTKDLQLIEGIFELHEINLFKSYEGSGEMLNLYMGDSFTGANLYVPSRQLDDAKQILENLKEGDKPAGEDDDFDPEEESVDFDEDIREQAGSSNGSSAKSMMALFLVLVFLGVAVLVYFTVGFF